MISFGINKIIQSLKTLARPRTASPADRRQRPSGGIQASVRKSNQSSGLEDCVVLFKKHARHVTGPICAGLSLDSPSTQREFTIKAVLLCVLRDWSHFKNKQGLTSEDVDDLRSFVDASIAMSGQGKDPVSQAVFRACLTALLRDWLENWNSTGRSGPPPT